MKLWLDDQADAPKGWSRARSQSELERFLRSGKVREMSLGGSDTLVESCVQFLEQGAFTNRIRPLKVELRCATGPLRDGAERSLANAAKHWAAMPPPPPPAKPSVGKKVLLYLTWHILGFALAVGCFEVWSLLRHGTHAPIVAWFIPDKPAAKRR
jgi:hypothetical protein